MTPIHLKTLDSENKTWYRIYGLRQNGTTQKGQKLFDTYKGAQQYIDRVIDLHVNRKNYSFVWVGR